ncbi:F-box-like protein [Ceratobasidium sp. AG-Ba]|nr:F-box-like protein [Ceratobasidium sp. AG-Ba]
MADALDQFLLSERRLQTAIEEFMTSCSALQNLTLDGQTANNDVDHKLNQIRACRNPLILAEQKISQSRTLLNNALSQFPPPASMRRLPTELLSRVIRHTVSHWCRSFPFDNTRILLILTWVCRRWRELVIRTPSLWSHVDLELVDYEDNPRAPELERLWLERAGDSLLHVHFQCGTNEFEYYAPRYVAFPQLVAMLVPHADQIATLGFEGLGARQIVEALTEIRLAQGSTNHITTLYIEGAAGTGFAPPGRIDPRPLAWPPSLFKGISELMINDLSEAQCPSLYQLLTILKNCPQLDSLRLRQMTIREDIGAISFPTVHLPRLRFLSLHDVRELGEKQILSFLYPGGLGLHLEINVVEDDSPTLRAATTFISRFGIISLCLLPPVFGDEEDSQITRYLPSSSSVHTLFLPLKNRSTSAINTLLDKTGKRPPTPLLPNLKTLCLMNGRFWPGDSNRLKELVKAYSLQRLVLVSCEAKVSDYGSGTGHDKGKHDYGEAVQWVSRQVPEVVIMKNYNPDSIYTHWYMFLRQLLSM